MSTNCINAACHNSAIDRRNFMGIASAALCTTVLNRNAVANDEPARRPFKLRYILGSSMYGYATLAEILPEVSKINASAIDIWPKKHGSQREQLDEIGEEKFTALLKAQNVSLGCITQYKLGPFALQAEMRLAQRLGCSTIVTAVNGQPGLHGNELKATIQKFVADMRPHLAVAEETGVTIAIENHANNLIESPDSMRWLAELRPDRRLALAFAPYHLPQDSKLLAKLITELGDSIAIFYAWQHGMGSKTKLPIEQELLQMPGRGKLDFAPLLSALQKIDYRGWTEIFMHPYPRGRAILPSTAEVTAEINRATKYLSNALAQPAK
jgi:sugar phosphate isomerase/epimerase